MSDRNATSDMPPEDCQAQAHEPPEGHRGAWQCEACGTTTVVAHSARGHVSARGVVTVQVMWPEHVRTLRISKPTGPDGAWTVLAWDDNGNLLDVGVGDDRDDILLEIILGPGFTM